MKPEKKKIIKKRSKQAIKKYARDFTTPLAPVVIKDYFHEGIRILIVSVYSHFTAYLGIPKDHPLAGFDYDDIPFEVHGGLTFGAEGDGETYPKDWFWYGWDYAHAFDYHYLGEYMIKKFKDEKLFQKRENEKDWTLKEVQEEAEIATWDFKKFIKLAEIIASKSYEQKTRRNFKNSKRI